MIYAPSSGLRRVSAPAGQPGSLRPNAAGHILQSVEAAGTSDDENVCSITGRNIPSAGLTRATKLGSTSWLSAARMTAGP